MIYIHSSSAPNKKTMNLNQNNDHDFNPSDFEPDRIHKIEKDTVQFSDKMKPAVALWNPKYPHNVVAAVSAASCFGAKIVIFSGDRTPFGKGKKFRLPREERMRGYYDITIINDDIFFDRFSKNVIPVAVELRENSEPPTTFLHPENPLCIFGPEDGNIPQV
jgi:hypothetical protein